MTSLRHFIVGYRFSRRHGGSVLNAVRFGIGYAEGWRAQRRDERTGAEHE